MKEESRKYAYWLCSIPGVGNRTIEKLLESCGGTAKAVYDAGEKQWEKVLRSRQLEGMNQFTRAWNPEVEYDKLKGSQIQFYSMEDGEYPRRLRVIPDAPYGLFVKGKLPEEEGLAVAIIGARDCSEYGRYVAKELGKKLGEQGIQIISGMARGVDGISQHAALEAGGKSFGVLGCGVDICYPTGNRKLYETLIAEGGVLSTYVPGTKPNARLFPPRNRIVSGLADVVIVVEARNKSGTLITVDMALEQGKDVYVVPGRITDRLSDGCNSLLRQGAGVMVSPEDFLEELAMKHPWHRKKKQKENPGTSILGIPEHLSGELREIYKALDLYPLSLEQIMEKLPEGYDWIKVNTGLLRLCMEKLAEQLSPGFFCRRQEQNSILLQRNPI